MSVKLMSAIFETEFRDLPDEDGNITKASTAKLVLLALADHANDEGEGAYPGLTRMERKTALSRQTVINTYGALKYNGIIYLAGISKRNTNNYTINVRSFPKANDDSQPILLVKPVDSTSQTTLLEVVNPLDPNHQLTIKETPLQSLKTDEVQGDYITQADRKVDAILDLEKQARQAEEAGLAYRGREFLAGSEYLTYGDWWHKKTGLHMYGAKAKAKVSPDWLKAFREWADNELTVKSLEAAFEANKWRGVISTPVVLTKDAIAIQAVPVVETTQREEGKSSGYYA